MEYDPTMTVMEDNEVYSPSEDSILLIESLDVVPGERILEIGCGSGIVSMHCAKNGCDVFCVDINEKAVTLTKNNFHINGLSGKICLSDLYQNVNGIFDTIIFNLPYLPVNDDGVLAKAWSGGEDGLGPLPALLDGASNHISSNGRVVVVVSSLMNQSALAELLSNYDVKELSSLRLFFEVLKVLEIKGFF